MTGRTALSQKKNAIILNIIHNIFTINVILSMELYGKISVLHLIIYSYNKKTHNV